MVCVRKIGKGQIIMQELAIILSRFDIFLLVLVRSSGLVTTAPLFGSHNLPHQLKAALAFLLSIIMFPLVVEGSRVPSSLFAYMLAAAGEIFLGIMLGFIFMLAFITVQLAGQFIDLRMGFAIANVIDPQYQTPIPLVGQFKYLLMIFIFVITDMHHFLIQSLYRTLSIIPPGRMWLGPGFLEFFIRISTDLFRLAFQFALPVICILLVIDISFGLVARVVPQMNVFILGFPVKILTGLVMLYFTAPYIVSSIISLLDWMSGNIEFFLKLLTQGV